MRVMPDVGKVRPIRRFALSSRDPSRMSKSDLSHAEKLDRLAEVAVKVGLGLKTGQEIVMTAPVEALDLARLVTKHAYKAGAKNVTTLFDD